MPASKPEHDLILQAMAGQRTERTPVWLMRQAGRFDPAYRDLRNRSGLKLEELFANPELAAEITVLPVRFGVDAAILFQDILTILGPMGAPFVFREGPVTANPVRTPADVEKLTHFDVHEHLSFVPRSIELVLDRLDGRLPLLGFAGSPFTLLAFLVEGQSPSFGAAAVRQFLDQYPEAALRLLDQLSRITIDYLAMQIKSGVHAIQLFESCSNLLDEDLYRRFALPAQKQIFAALQQSSDVPMILFAREVSPGLLAESGATVISIDSSQDLRAARGISGPKCVQGNVCNKLLQNGPIEAIESATRSCIDAGESTGHVLNLGHGVLKDTPVSHVEAMLRVAHEYRTGNES